jgi:pilus assembly protein CpaB
VPHKALIASAVAALATFALLRVYLHRFELEATGGPKHEVVMLARDLEHGALIERDALATRELPESYLESRHVTARDLDRLVGLTLAVPGRAGEALLWTDLTSLRRGAARLSSLLPAGMRAMTLAPRGSSDALLEPGDRVDVLATGSETTAAEPTRTRIVAEAVLVLATGEPTDTSNEPRRGTRRGAVTVAVTPEQGRALAEAELTTPLRLLLCDAEQRE